MSYCKGENHVPITLGLSSVRLLDVSQAEIPQSCLPAGAANGARLGALWKRKDPRNRVTRRRIRNAKGQTIGYEPPSPFAEPRLCPIFSHKVLEQRHVDKKGNLFREGFLDEKIVTDDLEIACDYAGARKPAKEPSDVRPLHVSIESIDALYEHARNWLQERDVK
jgi:hypothetical protein